MNLVNNLRGCHCFGSSSTRCNTGGKSPRLQWPTQFLMVHNPLMLLSEWCEFPLAPCLEGKKNLMTALISMLLKFRASLDMIPFSLCNKKILAIQHINRPLFPTTLLIPSYNSGKYFGLRIYQHPFVFSFSLYLVFHLLGYGNF